MDSVAKALQLKKELDQLRPIKPEDERRIMDKFRLDWNYHSNNLEGNSLTYGETKALILFGITAQGKPLKDHFEITGHNEAINLVLDVVKEERPLTENFIRELHKLLLKESYEADAITPDGKPTKKRITIGAYKTQPNHVKTKTGEIFRFSTPEETPALMHDLMEWLGEEKAKDLNPVLVAAEFHYRFIRIHPFDDGNGRLARILMNFILMQYGFPPVIIKTEDKENYFAALRLADVGQIEPFVEYIGGNLVRCLEIMIKGAIGESIEEPDDLDKEIALLDKKLESLINLSGVIKSKGYLTNFLNPFIYSLQEELRKSWSVFEKHYDKSVSRILLNGSKTNLLFKHSLHLLVDELLRKQETEITIINSFSGFKAAAVGSFDFTSQISVVFHEDQVIISLPEDYLVISSIYNKPLEQDDIRKIVNADKRRHKELIENKIREAESKNGTPARKP
ncbi:Fic family protein [uncultured Imperialibacter sp.]|uniref:Fic family protein n=1 Tax=uncultured Imperialibacter sp. TaxID=1672639 RepID=UPI0030D86223|tara:strand:+ start:14521 stop:15876 length:1356 start_codon:yes stop_codon:yes gene_type:complete